MIVLDTNVVSEPLKPRPEPCVGEWIRASSKAELHLTATVVAELGQGIAVLQPGRKRIELQDALDLMIAEEYDGRVLPFDLEAARAYALVIERRTVLGRPIRAEDAQLAAVCLVHDAALATRNTRDFEGLGLTLIDPWVEGCAEG